MDFGHGGGGRRSPGTSNFHFMQISCAAAYYKYLWRISVQFSLKMLKIGEPGIMQVNSGIASANYMITVRQILCAIQLG